MPDFSFELSIGGYIAGIDEAGRGPWAGPVYAAAVVFNPMDIPDGLAREINDSKKLSAKKRETIAPRILDYATVGRGSASVSEIDNLNILRATHLAMKRAFEDIHCEVNTAIVDGNIPPNLSCPVVCLVKGDTKSLSIAAASIISKVSRDQYMIKLSHNYPGYGWHKNFGYGTKEHREGILQHGITPHHRKSFKPIRNLL